MFTTFAVRWVGGFGKLRVMLISAQLGLEAGTGAELGNMSSKYNLLCDKINWHERWFRKRVSGKLKWPLFS